MVRIERVGTELAQIEANEAGFDRVSAGSTPLVEGSCESTRPKHANPNPNRLKNNRMTLRKANGAGECPERPARNPDIAISFSAAPAAICKRQEQTYFASAPKVSAISAATRSSAFILALVSLYRQLEQLGRVEIQ